VPRQSGEAWKVEVSWTLNAHRKQYELYANKVPINSLSIFIKIELKSLILAQIERWRHALHMQVERQHGSNPGGEWRTGE
jgi:hypothetical protein